jgi:hypothetical protein
MAFGIVLKLINKFLIKTEGKIKAIASLIQNNARSYALQDQSPKNVISLWSNLPCRLGGGGK